MSNWWWADYVDKYLTDQLAECAQWLKQSPESHFVVTLTVPMSDSDGSWAVWLNFSPVEEARGSKIKMLLDSASSSDFSPLIMHRAIVTDYCSPEWVVVPGGPPGMEMRRKDDLLRWMPQSEPSFSPNHAAPPNDQARLLASELCQRHSGSNLTAERDGVMSFVITV